MENWLFDKIIEDYHLYAQQFQNSPELVLKYNHSKNVSLLAKQISEFVAPSNETSQIIEIAALYHDIGRFTQFQKYHTFNDSISANHAELGVKIMSDFPNFDSLNQDEKRMIYNVVNNHNKFKIEDSLDHVTALVCNIIRDADKIDILKTLANSYKSNVYNAAVFLDLPDIDSYNPLIVQDLLSAKSVDFSMMETLNDFKLANLGWVFDLNFAISHLILHKANVLQDIYQSITVKSKEIDMAYQMVEGVCEAYSI